MNKSDEKGCGERDPKACQGKDQYKTYEDDVDELLEELTIIEVTDEDEYDE